MEDKGRRFCNQWSAVLIAFPSSRGAVDPLWTSVQSIGKMRGFLPQQIWKEGGGSAQDLNMMITDWSFLKVQAKLLFWPYLTCVGMISWSGLRLVSYTAQHSQKLPEYGLGLPDWAGAWTEWPPQVPSHLRCAVILWMWWVELRFWYAYCARFQCFGLDSLSCLFMGWMPCSSGNVLATVAV